MPWCEECEELVEEEDLTEEGECPACGTQIMDQPGRPIPWYFKSLIVATIVYLGYRAYQGITWVAHHV